VRLIIRLPRRAVLVNRRTASDPVANDERVTGAGLPCSEMANGERAEHQLKRECKGRCGGNPLPQAALISVRSQHRVPLAEPLISIPIDGVEYEARFPDVGLCAACDVSATTSAPAVGRRCPPTPIKRFVRAKAFCARRRAVRASCAASGEHAKLQPLLHAGFQPAQRTPYHPPRTGAHNRALT
jgi:hypothetical protein